ncbi:hypothetical protein Slin15195_G057090 [Septoria linicola]|uniref:Uncharacterized protein n=1 Tax=Septoria linicola TaxID=215465 RepID=A0A9Q9ATS2_9PEZI|nr:hypothetical protein Slin14017_G072960 [Septoria linicola]USW52390.1 hypothetical protein Slin15195_G057090 [Septoria linicola]
MPSLFGSRRRGSSAARQPLDANTAYAANVAARAAASGSRPGTSNGLSSAAAAAALRSLTSSPEPVGSIQTKRMIRRGSQSSIGSASIMSGRGGAQQQQRSGMQRRGSQSSMTERTFRSPSPGRSNSITNNGPQSPASRAPPVPAIPQNVQQRAHQRSSSVDPPQRVYSPTPNGRGGRTSSMDRSTLPPPSSSRKGARLSDVNEELERSESQRGVNFSRPRSSQPNSPGTSPTTDKFTHGTGGWFAEPVRNKPASRAGPGPDADALAAKMSRIQGAQGQNVKKDNASSASQGASLKPYTQPTITGTAVKPQPSLQPAMETVMVYDANSRTFVPQLKPKPAAVQPPSPTLPQAPPAAPGTYDPHTRTIVPVVQPVTAAPSSRPAPPTLDTEVAPPPRNPARLSPSSSPRSSYLNVQPPLSDDEDVSNTDSPQASRIIQTSVGPAKSYVAVQKPRSSSLDVPSRNAPSTRGRQVSASPSPQRKPHFSASPVSQAIIHNPLPRDVSPAKSALKHSPAPSVRATSPLAHFAGHPKAPASEASDATSVYSQDGISSVKKKKSVRVSFDEQPHQMETTPSTGSKASARDRATMLDDSDDEDFSKPRPALPTFGSVRKNREVAEKVTEMAPDRNEHSSDHAVGAVLHNANGTTKAANEPMPPVVTSKETPSNISDTDSTSDLGDLGEYAAANAAAVSLPEQTAGQTAQIPDEVSQKSPVEPIVRDFASSTAAGQKLDPGVPQINLMPPTPGTEEFKSLDNRQSAEIVVPGAWSAENESSTKTSNDTIAGSDDVPASIAPVMVHTPEEHSPMLAPIDEDTDTDDAEFSDAAEDPSEFEGGFASLDAIAVSPINVKTSPAAQSANGTTSPPESPLTQKATKNLESSDAPDNESGKDWSTATAYWSKLSRQQREQIERDHMSSDDEARPAPSSMKKTRKTTASSPQSAQKSAPAHREAQPAQPALKKTMRAQPAPAPVDPSRSMRRSMRDGGGGGLSGGSLRSRPASAQQAPAEPRAGALSKKTMRPQSSGAVSSPTTGGVSNNRPSQDSSYERTVARPASTATTATAPPRVVSSRLQRELSHDSDSESSFKKKRRANGAASSGISMKRSMRGGPPERGPPEREQRPSSPDRVRGKGKDSFSIRSLSPTGSFFGRKKGKEVRESIRGASMDGGSRMTSMRTAQPAKTLRQTPVAAPKQKASSSRFKSRFADSDDSDDDAPPARSGGGFRSRFADSDEEDDVLTPVRGIPRRKGQDDGDSTDLDDSEEEGAGKPFSRGRDRQKAPLVPDPADVDKAMEAARKKLGITAEPVASPPSTPQRQDDKQGSALTHGSLRNSHAPPSRPQSPDLASTKKKGFMGSFLRRNRSSQQSIMTVSGLPQSNGASMMQGTPGSPPLANRQTFERPQSPTQSPGKLIRRSSGQPQTRQRMARGDSSYSTATAPPMVGESNWPLSDAPPVPAIPGDVAQLKGDRPATSDGQGVRFSEDALKSPGAYSSRTGKKKKFGLLRKAFGLKD